MNKEIKERIRQAKCLGCTGVLVFNLTEEDKASILKKGMKVEREAKHDFSHDTTQYKGYMINFTK